MDFRFNEGGGFVVAKHLISRSMPEEYAILFRLRGRGAPVDLELKLVDLTGRNVWRYVFKKLQLPVRWRRIKVESRKIEFGWGPAGGGSIAELGSLEFAIVANAAGAGSLWIDDVRIENAGPSQAPLVTASSQVADFEASAALTAAGWKPRVDDAEPWLSIDSGEPRRIGGLVIDWLHVAPASGFRVLGSSGGSRWKILHAAKSAGGKRSYVYLPETKLRFLRLELAEPTAGAAVRLQSFEFSRSIESFWYNVAKTESRGFTPRWLHREQTLWTPIGTSHGTQCALMNDDGMVEVSQGSFSIEPMLWIQDRLYTWSDVTPRQELLHDWLPVPSVIWESKDWRLRIQAEETVSGVLRVRYRCENLTPQALSARLFVLVRPFQVTPPWQSFRQMGGVSRIRDLEFRDGAVRVNENTLLRAVPAPQGFGALGFDDGFLGSHLSTGKLPPKTRANDRLGFASGALEFDWALGALGVGESVVACLPVDDGRDIDEPAFDWGRKLAVSQWGGNGWIGDAVRTALTATAHVLITRSGPALQPGPRRYTRSWIRDGAMMGAALLRMGHAQEVRDYIRWYAPHQREDGFVPCCVDRDGIDWLVEHDSHGQLIALIADHYRFTADRAFLEETWPYVDRAARCISQLLDSTGLLPISVSHEGYLAQPVHSYWDDFWALRGLRDAVELARVREDDQSAREFAALTTRFDAALFASIEATRAQRRLDFIPGSIEWADFDPTATANALYLLDLPEGLNRRAVERTFDLYLEEWQRKRSGAVQWTNYTPYEIRIIGALVRLGRREAALQLLDFFLSDRRPRPWNQWPEIAWRDQSTPAHLGDLPHTWIAAEYVLALRSLFAYEREADQSLVLAAGLDPHWIEGAGVIVNRMPTAHGELSYSLLRVDSRTVRFQIDGGVTAKLLLRPPLPGPLRGVRVNGSVWSKFDEHSVTVLETPVQVVCTI
ncbi:MAG: discoidin domain-containing protein [Pseudomonadota bacterium]|nr:discoidin domain-containing protein [Pseudomonadota bacterium]